MKEGKLELQTPDEAETVFYEAFKRCDAKVMAALWAEDDVVCVHPGAGVLVGHEAVVRSWTNIFGNAHPPSIKIDVARRTRTDDLAVHLVAQQMGADTQDPALVVATNVYRKYDAGWLMVEHHASLVQSETRNQTLQ